MAYRRDIDGLRGIAVLAVVLYHAGFSPFAGGFVGVDVFFVLSGYLITDLILAQHADATFDLARFYARRARRILPALLMVTAATIPFGWAWLLPQEFAAYARSLIAVPLFASNFLFRSEADYFGPATEEMPLLHTWSLAVEEQFYLLFPVALLGALRLGGRRVFFLLGVVGIASLAAADFLSIVLPKDAFFLPHTRLWEFLAGSLCIALRGTAFAAALNRSGATGPIGLVMILASILVFDPSTRWPSVLTLVPVLGTSLVLMAGPAPGPLQGLLTHRLLVGLGLVSYSLYLWHQPVFAFARIASPVALSAPTWLGLIILSLVLAWTTWRGIETPFRTGRGPAPVPWRPAVALLAAVSGPILAVGLHGHASDGAPDRFEAALTPILAVAAERNPHRATCHFDPGRAPPNPPLEACWLNGEGSRRVALLGDSHADALAMALGEEMGAHGIDVQQLTHSGCAPIPALRTEPPSHDRSCTGFNRRVLDWVVEDRGIEVVILAARWTLYFEGERFDNGEGGVEPGPAGGVSPRTPGPRREGIEEAYREGLEALARAGKHVIVVYPIPEAGWDVPRQVVRRVPFSAVESIAVSTARSKFDRRNAATIAALDAATHPTLHRVFPHEVLCSAGTGRCLNARGHSVLYRDDDHLSHEGARLVVPAIAERSLEALSTEPASDASRKLLSARDPTGS